MKKFINLFKIPILLITSIFLIIFIPDKIFANDIIIEINGNNYTDDDVILSLLDKKPEILERYCTLS